MMNVPAEIEAFERAIQSADGLLEHLDEDDGLGKPPELEPTCLKHLSLRRRPVERTPSPVHN